MLSLHSVFHHHRYCTTIISFPFCSQQPSFPTSISPAMASSQKEKRRIQAPRRIAVDFGEPSPSGLSLESVTSREERLQPSTGRRYQAQRVLVVDNSWLPPENSDIGLDPDGSKSETALENVGIEDEARENPQASKKRKKKQKSMASVSDGIDRACSDCLQ